MDANKFHTQPTQSTLYNHRAYNINAFRKTVHLYFNKKLEDKLTKEELDFLMREKQKKDDIFAIQVEEYNSYSLLTYKYRYFYAFDNQYSLDFIDDGSFEFKKL